MPPASEIGDEIGEATAGLWSELVAVEERRCRDEERLLGGAGMAVDRRHCLVAKAALGGVDDLLEREVVCGRDDEPQIGDRIANLGALVEAEAADDLIGETDRDKALLELAGLELSANEDRNRVEVPPRASCDSISSADSARLLGPVPYPDDADLLAVTSVGPQGLPEPAGIASDEFVGGGQDVSSRPVVLLQADDLRAREILLEAEDVGDLGSAPAVDRLIVVADTAEIAARFSQEFQPFILRRLVS